MELGKRKHAQRKTLQTMKKEFTMEDFRDQVVFDEANSEDGAFLLLDFIVVCGYAARFSRRAFDPRCQIFVFLRRLPRLR